MIGAAPFTCTGKSPSEPLTAHLQEGDQGQYRRLCSAEMPAAARSHQPAPCRPVAPDSTSARSKGAVALTEAAQQGPCAFDHFRLNSLVNFRYIGQLQNGQRCLHRARGRFSVHGDPTFAAIGTGQALLAAGQKTLGECHQLWIRVLWKLLEVLENEYVRVVGGAGLLETAMRLAEHAAKRFTRLVERRRVATERGFKICE